MFENLTEKLSERSRICAGRAAHDEHLNTALAEIAKRCSKAT